jgi:hypothetical protein
MSIFAALLRDTLAMVLVLAAGAKLADVAGFGRTLAGLGLHQVTTQGRQAIALLFIMTEGGLGLLTVAQAAVPVVNLLNVAMTFLFTAATAWAVARGIQTHCRCFGALSGTTFSRQGLVRAALLLGIAVTAAVIGDRDLDITWLTLVSVVAFAAVGFASTQASAVLSDIRLRA